MPKIVTYGEFKMGMASIKPKIPPLEIMKVTPDISSIDIKISFNKIEPD